MSVLIAIATYNEIENLPRLVNEIFHFTPDADVLIVDDHSPDGTGDWAEQFAAQDNRLRCIHRRGKLGLGSATLRGMEEAIERGYQFVVNMDADFSHHPKYLRDLIGGMETESRTVDVMVGTRYAAGGGIEGWPRSRRIMSRMVNRFARSLLGLSVSDCSGSFRCYRTLILRKIDFSKVKSSGYSFFEEILWHLKLAGAKFDELPIVFVNRELGKSKISLKEALKAAWVISAIGIRARFGRR